MKRFGVKIGLHPNMTEKMLTGILMHNQTKRNRLFVARLVEDLNLDAIACHSTDLCDYGCAYTG